MGRLALTRLCAALCWNSSISRRMIWLAKMNVKLVGFYFTHSSVCFASFTYQIFTQSLGLWATCMELTKMWELDYTLIWFIGSFAIDLIGSRAVKRDLNALIWYAAREGQMCEPGEEGRFDVLTIMTSPWDYISPVNICIVYTGFMVCFRSRNIHENIWLQGCMVCFISTNINENFWLHCGNYRSE